MFQCGFCVEIPAPGHACFPKLLDARQGLLENGLRGEERAGAPLSFGLTGLPLISDRVVININIIFDIIDSSMLNHEM